jgi:hypothetical protein
MELKILYVHGYGSKINRTGRAIEKQAKYRFDSVRVLYNHYYDEIRSVRQIREAVSRIDADCRTFNPHILIGSSLGGFLAANISGYVRILINPCLLPSEHVGILAPDMPVTDPESLKQMERSRLQPGNADFDTWGLFSNHDELFGGSGYKDLFQQTYGTAHVRTMDSPHRISETAIRENLMPVITEITGRLNECPPHEKGLPSIRKSFDSGTNEDEQSVHETGNEICDLLNSRSFDGAPVAFDPRHWHECYEKQVLEMKFCHQHFSPPVRNEAVKFMHLP